MSFLFFTGESVTQLYSAIELFSVNAETVHNAVKQQFTEDGLTFENLISVLSDSAAYMRGEYSGFYVRLKEDAPHILDVSGDVCHTVHNAVKQFCSVFDNDKCVSKLLTDVFNDFHYSADLRHELTMIAEALDLQKLMPLQRIACRWLSIFDATERLMEILPQLTVFYFAFLSQEDKVLYQFLLTRILRDISQKQRDKINTAMEVLKFKKPRCTQKGNLLVFYFEIKLKSYIWLKREILNF